MRWVRAACSKVIPPSVWGTRQTVRGKTAAPAPGGRLRAHLRANRSSRGMGARSSWRGGFGAWRGVPERARSLRSGASAAFPARAQPAASPGWTAALPTVRAEDRAESEGAPRSA